MIYCIILHKMLDMEDPYSHQSPTCSTPAPTSLGSKLVQVMGNTNSHRPMFECYDNCACDPVRCGNRVVQAGPVNNLQVVEVGGQGGGEHEGCGVCVGICWGGYW